MNKKCLNYILSGKITVDTRPEIIKAILPTSRVEKTRKTRISTMCITSTNPPKIGGNLL